MKSTKILAFNHSSPEQLWLIIGEDKEKIGKKFDYIKDISDLHGDITIEHDDETLMAGEINLEKARVNSMELFDRVKEMGEEEDWPDGLEELADYGNGEFYMCLTFDGDRPNTHYSVRSAGKTAEDFWQNYLKRIENSEVDNDSSSQICIFNIDTYEDVIGHGPIVLEGQELKFLGLLLEDQKN